LGGGKRSALGNSALNRKRIAKKGNKQKKMLFSYKWGGKVDMRSPSDTRDSTSKAKTKGHGQWGGNWQEKGRKS